MRKFSRHSQEDSPKRKTRKDKTSAEAKETIINFLRQGDTVFQQTYQIQKELNPILRKEECSTRLEKKPIENMEKVN